MANTTKSMQQIRHILQLRAQGVSIREIRNTTGVSRPTIRIYLSRWEAMGLPWEQLSALDDEALGTILYQEVQTGVDRDRLEDLQGRIPKMLRDLSKTGVTRQLLWHEYRLQRPDGYGYTQFCEYLGIAAHRSKAVMHFEHKAGERLMIDFAGKKLHYVDMDSAEQIALLASCNFIRQPQNLLITGATGCGKSFLACALGRHACQMGYKTLYLNMNRFIEKIAAAKLDGSYVKVLNQIEKIPLLILDDFGLQPLDQNLRLALLQILEDRYAKRPIVIASQLPVAEWYNYLGEPTLADAILDRLTANASRIELKGNSMRQLAKY